MTCEEVRERLTAFVDGELDPVASREVEAHLAGCAGCVAELAELRTLRARLGQELEYHRASDVLRARVVRDARAGRRSRPVAARGGRWLAVAAAMLMVAGGAWWVSSRAGHGDALLHEAVSNHIRSLMAGHLTDVASTDQHTVKPWFNGKIDFSPPVTDFAAEGYPLVGGRLDYLESRAVAALVYRHRQHVINVFVWPVIDERDQVATAGSEQGFHVVRGTHAGMAWWVVSDLNSDELETFARRLTGAPARR